MAERGPTQAAGQEGAEYGITVNVYCLGIVGTAMWDLTREELANNRACRRARPSSSTRC